MGANGRQQRHHRLVCAGSLVKPEKLTGWPSQWRRMIGTQAAFLTSGLVHESFLWYVLSPGHADCTASWAGQVRCPLDTRIAHQGVRRMMAQQ